MSSLSVFNSDSATNVITVFKNVYFVKQTLCMRDLR